MFRHPNFTCENGEGETNPSRLISYLPVASPHTTPALIADIPKKLLILTTPKTIKDFTLDGPPNNRWFYDKLGSTGKWFIVQMTTSLEISAQNQTVTLEMYKNGVFEEGVSIARFMAGGTDVGTLSLVGATQLNHLDYIEVYVTMTSAGTITFKRLGITINELVGAI